MTLPHFHSSSFAKQHSIVHTEHELILGADIVAHLCTLRMTQGERFILLDGQGNADTLELLERPLRTALSIRVRFCERQTFERPARHVTLIQGISVGERMDQTIRQVTELGVAGIIPLMSQRSVVRFDETSRSKKTERWQRLAQAAAEQSAQAFVPMIYQPCSLTEALSLVSDYDALLVAWEEYDEIGIGAALKTANVPACARVAVCVGPEGGFEATEIDVMRDAGAIPMSLGRTILRTETAAVVACALTLYELGELGNI